MVRNALLEQFRDCIHTNCWLYTTAASRGIELGHLFLSTFCLVRYYIGIFKPSFEDSTGVCRYAFLPAT